MALIFIRSWPSAAPTINLNLLGSWVVYCYGTSSVKEVISIQQAAIVRMGFIGH